MKLSGNTRLVPEDEQLFTLELGKRTDAAFSIEKLHFKNAGRENLHNGVPTCPAARPSLGLSSSSATPSKSLTAVCCSLHP
jgi:hypothetical protein